MNRTLIFFCAAVIPFVLSSVPPAFSAGCTDVPGDTYSRMSGDTLIIGNSLVERCFIWNGGNLMTVSLADKSSGRVMRSASLRPDFVVSRNTGCGTDGRIAVVDVPESRIHPAYQKTVVTYALGDLDIRREYRVYSGCPAIACDTWVRGRMDAAPDGAETENADRGNIEFAEDMDSGTVTAVLDRLNFPGQHWHARTVEFWDVTDWNNNLVDSRDFISYRKNGFRGNLLFARDGRDGNGFWFLKEAPCSSVQLAYRGQDFITEFGHFIVTGLGFSGSDISAGEWTRAYSCVTGVYSGGEREALLSLRAYQKNIRRHQDGRDEMIMMNTWGDRSQDSKVNEKFCLEELEKAARLGVTHFQIDDGWQSGKSPNSAVAKGSFRNIWDNPDYWTPDQGKYPRGLAPVVERGHELGIEIGLWFNPSVQDDFADWEKDAGAIVGLYRKYGIRTFKIDGLTIAGKKAETNLRRLFDTVLAQTDSMVVFNLDATASRRGGYHMFNEYGNIFLENRYTDWGNWYPYWTLRNVWMLSRYVPAERIQVEFLNKWRNPGNYPGDPFAPAGYTFGYVFATAMAGQPLAWMEASNLPEEAFGLGPLVKAYRSVSADFHSGTILPVGDEPSGRSWTGFQSILDDNRGYFLIYREDNPSAVAPVKTWLDAGKTVKLVPVLGSGKPFRTRTGHDGTVSFRLPERNSFVMYRYETE